MAIRAPSRTGNLKRLMFAAGGLAFARKVITVIRRDGIGSATRQVRNLWHVSRPRSVPGEPSVDRGDYKEWIRRYDTMTPERRQAMETEMARLQYRPRISVLMPTYNSGRHWLVDAIQSVQDQIYPDWELCIVDDASPMPHVREVLQKFEQQDSRIKVRYREANGHISAASNDALALATGEWVALLDHDDLLAPDALLQVVAAMNERRGARLVYTDEDKLGPLGRFDPYLKADWNPDLFLSQNMFSHLGVIQTSLAREVGGFRQGLEGSQDFDLVLRCVERVRPDQVVHVPKVLYHWRVHGESTSLSQNAKPYAQLSAVRALQEHCDRVGISADVVSTVYGYRAIYRLPESRPMAILLVKDAGKVEPAILQRCIQALQRTTEYQPVKIVLVGADVSVAHGLPCIPALTTEDLDSVLPGDDVVVCLFSAELQPQHDDWLTELVRQACRPEVGLVGPLILDERGTIQSAGIVFAPAGNGRFRAMDAHAGYPSTLAGHGSRAQLVQRLSAVRNLCVAMRKPVFRKLEHRGMFSVRDGGVALSAEVRHLGLNVVWTPHSAVVTDSAMLRSRPLGACTFPTRYDPSYNPNLFAEEGDFTFAWPPINSGFGPL